MKIGFASDNKKPGQVLYALAHGSLKPEFSIEQIDKWVMRETANHSGIRRVYLISVSS